MMQPVSAKEMKREVVAQLKSMLLDYPVVGIVDVEGVPAKQLQRIRALLRGDTSIRAAKKSIARRALEEAGAEKKGLAELKEYVKNQPAFMFSRINSFKLSGILAKNKAPAPAKPNSIAPRDIVVLRGDTPFPPGPFMAELQQIGVPTAIVGGKISVKADTTVAKAGQKIAPKVAAIMGKLGIEPMEVGLSLVASYEDGALFTADVLKIDEAGLIADIQRAHISAFNLAVNAAYPTKQTIELMISKAYSDARALALEAEIYEPEVMELLLGKAHAGAKALEASLGDKWRESKAGEGAQGEAKTEKGQ